VAHANLGLRTVVEELSQGDAPMEEVLPLAKLVKEGSGTGMPNLLPEVEAQTAPPPHQADASSMGRKNEKMVREELPAREVMAVAKEEALAVGGEAAGAILAGVMSQEVPITLVLTGAADPCHGRRALPSLAQTGRDVPARGVPRTRGTPLQ
jgi:hypothetical protein